MRVIILGTAQSNGSEPKIQDCYDTKSRGSVLAENYPKENDIILEMDTLEAILKKYDVQVYRPNIIKNCNQIFFRNIAFVIKIK